MLDLVWSGAAVFSNAERAEADRVTGTGSIAERAGCSTEASTEQVRAAAIQAVARWRERAADAMNDRQTALCCETVARSYEGIYASA